MLAQALAALLGSLLLGAAHDAIALSVECDLELDLGDRVRGGVVGTEGLTRRAHARHGAEEGERDGIEDGGLAGAGGSVQEEQPGLGQLVEVDSGPIAERPEGRDGE